MINSTVTIQCHFLKFVQKVIFFPVYLTVRWWFITLGTIVIVIITIIMIFLSLSLCLDHASCMSTTSSSLSPNNSSLGKVITYHHHQWDWWFAFSRNNLFLSQINIFLHFSILEFLVWTVWTSLFRLRTKRGFVNMQQSNWGIRTRLLES